MRMGRDGRGFIEFPVESIWNYHTRSEEDVNGNERLQVSLLTRVRDDLSKYRCFNIAID